MTAGHWVSHDAYWSICHEAMEKEVSPASWVSVGNGLEMGGIPFLHPPMSVPVRPLHGKITSALVNLEPWETASHLLYTGFSQQ